MKRPELILLLFFILYIFTEVSAGAQLWKQKRFEAVAGAGPSFFFGDIGGYSQGENNLGIKDLTFLQTRADLNLNLRYRILSDLNARLSLTTGLLRATDARGSNEGRAMSSSIFIFEPALIGEFYFIKNSAEKSYLFSKRQKRARNSIFSDMDFYAFAGIGGVSYSARGNDKLVTKNIDNKGFAAVIPVGFGASLIYSPELNFGVELGGRYSFSDYIDGYTSQYSNSNDVYYFLNFTVTYKLMTGKNGWPTFR